jgi:uncharacterized protein YcbX
MHISEINIYPIKSLRGTSLAAAETEDRGLKFDRRWMLVDEKGKFITQREFPLMAAVNVTVEGDFLTAAYDGSEISVPLFPTGVDSRRVSVWSSSLRALRYREDAGEWFSDVLKTKCDLVRMPDEAARIVNPLYAVRKFKDRVSFADGYPFMLIGQASLDDLNSRLPNPVPMNRFRPNFVVKDAEPFAEDTWKKVRIGATIFHVVKPCARCVIPTIDQEAGKKTGQEPLKTLASYRTKRNKVLFGQNLIAEEAGGLIKIGAGVEVLQFKD